MEIKNNNCEEAKYGPITIIRDGRYIHFKSDFTPEGFKKYRESLKVNRIALNKKINSSINKLLKLIKKFDPLFFLIPISIKNIFGSPELYKEVTHEGRECYVEYAQSLILSQDNKNTVNKPPDCKVKYFEKIIQELFQNILYFYTFENVEEKYNKVDSELRFLSLIKYIFVRGDSIIEHHLEMVKDIFSDHDIFLKNNFGMDTGQILEAINEVELQLNNNLVIYDDNIFIIEAKAGTMSPSAKRGSPERIRVQIKKLIEEAYIQAKRTRDYIINTPGPKFEYENGLEAVAICGKEKYKNIFLINVTLQSLSQFSTKLNSLRKIGLIEGKEWPWSVYINDLRIISELIESPSIFLCFLKQRIKANDNPQFYAIDELDFLMYFFKEGLYFDNKNKSKTKIIPSGYTQEIDRYYDYKAGRVTDGKKPCLEINEDFKKLIIEIENTGKPGFTEVTTTLLLFDKETKDEVAKSIKVIKENSSKDGKDHNFTMTFNNKYLGFTVLNIANAREMSMEEIDNYFNSAIKSNKFDKWILIFLYSLNKKIDFKVYYSGSFNK